MINEQLRLAEPYGRVKKRARVALLLDLDPNARRPSGALAGRGMS